MTGAAPAGAHQTLDVVPWSSPYIFGSSMMPSETPGQCTLQVPAALPAPMDTLHGIPRTSTWLLGLLVCIVTPLSVAYLVKQRQFSAMYATVSAGYWCASGCLLLLRPTNARLAAMINSLGLLTWCVRLGHTLHMILQLPPQFKRLYHNGTAYLILTASSLFQMVLTRCMGRRLCTPLCIIYAAMFAHAASLYDAGIQRPWWWPLLLHVATQLCVLGPYTALNAVLSGRAATQPAATRTSNSHLGRTQKSTAEPSHADGSSSNQARSGGTDYGPDLVAFCDHQPGCEQVPPSTSSAAAAVSAPNDTRTGTHARGLAPDTGSYAHKFVRDKPQRAAAKLEHKAALVDALKVAPYKSRLGCNQKVCLKLDTQLSCSDLPPDLAHHMQQALCRIGMPALRITDLAVRPGCIMISLTMRDTSSEGDSIAATANDQPVAADMSAQVLTKALLQELQHVCAMHSADKGTTGALACSRALLQVDKQLFSAARQDDTWTFQPAGQQLPGASSTPWLGTAVPVTAHGSLQQGRAPLDTALIQLLLDIQLWGLTKLDEVEGWAPPAPGEHGVGRRRNTASSIGTGMWPSLADAEISASDSVKTGAGRSMKLLARIGGDYLVTHVQRVLRPTGSSNASVQVVIDLPLSYLVRHHPGGVPSSLLLLSLELWEGEVFLSSSPIISLSQAMTSAAGLNSSAWWWGASEGVVTAAMTEMEALACGLASMEPEGSAGPVASHIALMEDVSTWLLGVHATAQACQHCTAAGQLGRQASSQLTPAALKLLGEGLQEYAASIGMHSLHAMLMKQNSAVRDWVAHQRVQSAISTARTKPRGAMWLQSIRVAALGYPCHLCEQQYKHQLREQLTRLQPVSNSTIALYALAANVQVMVKSEVFVYAAFFTPWMLLHVAGAVHSLVLKTQQQQQQQQQPTRSLYWTVPAYALRLLLFSLYASGYVRMPLVSRRLLHMPLAWALTQLVFTLVEQVQCTAVLPTALVTFMAVCVDLPAALVRASREKGMWGTHLLLAPLVVVVARLVLDAHTRKLLQHQQHGSKRRNNSTGLVRKG